MTLNYQEKRKNGAVVSRGIEWTNATWNPGSGCLHGCRWTMPDGSEAICYAESVANRIAKSIYNEGFDHAYWKPQHLESPKKVTTPLKIFVGSMWDMFGHWVPDEQIQQVLDVARACPQHSFQLLTKNPVRTKHFDMPSNVWVGASMPPDTMWGKVLSQSQKYRMLETTMKALAGANARIKWISFEPLSWDVSAIVAKYPGVLDWAVIGAASNGAKLYPPAETDFVRLHNVLKYQRVPVFFKGNLASLTVAAVQWREDFPVN